MFTLKIDTTTLDEWEIATILRNLSTRLLDGEDFSHYRTVYDSDGQDVGRAKLTKADKE